MMRRITIMGVQRDPHATRLGEFLKTCIKFGASDLIIKTDQPPKLRMRGALKPLDTPPVTAEDWKQIINATLDKEQLEDLAHYGSVDFAYDYDESARFRMNLFKARGHISLAARLITSNILPFEKLHLPEAMGQIALQPQGIVLLSGVTGSGKSTTIASMIDYVNQRKNVHIVTIEDPIEYIFHGQVAQPSMISPSPSGPPWWAQTLLSAVSEEPSRNTATRSPPPRQTTRARLSGMFEALPMSTQPSSAVVGMVASRRHSRKPAVRCIAPSRSAPIARSAG